MNRTITAKIITAIMFTGLLAVGVSACSNKTTANTTTHTTSIKTEPTFAPGIPKNYQITNPNDKSICSSVEFIANDLTKKITQNPDLYNSPEYLNEAKKLVDVWIGAGFLKGKSEFYKIQYGSSPFLAWARSITKYWAEGSAFNPKTNKYDPGYLVQINNFKNVCGNYYS